MRREIFSEEHDLFREQVRRFVEREVEPRVPEWNERGMTDREISRRLGEEGLLGANQPIEYGGAGGAWWTTELQKRLTSQCLQLHGG
jgi:acyl-CoA dehydrogenase